MTTNMPAEAGQLARTPCASGTQDLEAPLNPPSLAVLPAPYRLRFAGPDVWELDCSCINQQTSGCLMLCRALGSAPAPLLLPIFLCAKIPLSIVEVTWHADVGVRALLREWDRTTHPRCAPLATNHMFLWRATTPRRPVLAQHKSQKPRKQLWEMPVRPLA